MPFRTLTPEQDARKRANAGRPRIEVDMKELAVLCRIQCTEEEIAAVFNVDRKTIQRWKKRKELREVMENNRLIGKMSLRRALYMRSLDKKQSPALLIFAAKNMLDMSDKLTSEITGKDGKPIEIRTTVREQIQRRIDGIAAKLGAPEASRQLLGDGTTGT